MKTRISAHSVLELTLAILIFSIFLMSVFSIFSYGLKNWKLVETKSDVQNQAQIATGRMLSDLTSTDISSLTTDTTPMKYIAFESAVNSTSGDVEKENGMVVWKGYVLYYTSPSDHNKVTKRLLRRYVPHENRTTPKQLDSIKMFLYLTDTPPASITDGELRTVASNIYDLDISINPNGYIVDISLVAWKNFSEKRLAYRKDFSSKLVNESLTLKASIMPRNTND